MKWIKALRGSRGLENIDMPCMLHRLGAGVYLHRGWWKVMELMPTSKHRQRNTEVKTAKAKACGFERQVQGYI